MKFYSKFISSKNFLLIFSLFFLLFSTVFWQAKINNERQIFYEPDDHFHYLIKATNNIYCKDHQCYEKNLFIDAEKNDLSDLDKFWIPRQIHRLIYSYHPLYTFVLEKISNDQNIFEVQKKFHLFLGVIIALLIIIYLKQFIKKEIIFLISLMLSSHLYYNFYGINFSIPWTISCLLGSIGVFYQFKSKTISCFLMFISAVTHKVGLIFFPLTIITYFIFFLTENKISLENI